MRTTRPTAPIPDGAAWFLVNPRAGRGRAAAVARHLARGLRRRGRPVVTTTDHPALAAPPPDRPAVAIAVGGDGTLRAAVARLLDLYGGDVPPVLPVPMGTANLMGQHLGLPRPVAQIAAEGVRHGLSLAGPFAGAAKLRALRDARAAARRTLAALDRGRAVPTDVGVANGSQFLLMAGVGFDAHVVRSLDARRTGAIGLLSYALPAAGAVAAFDFPPLVVRADGRHLWGPARGVVMVANVPQYGTGFPIVPHARADDGRLDVLCLPCAGRGDLLKLFALAAVGDHLPRGVSATAAHVEVTADAPVPVQVDGDPGGTLPLTVDVLPAAVPLVPLVSG